MAAGARTSYFGHDDWAPLRARAQGPRRRAGGPAARAAWRSRRRSARPIPRERQRLLTFVVVGGGPTGVELAGAIADLSRDILAVDFQRAAIAKAVRVVLVERADRILTPFDPPLSERARGAAGGAGRRGADRRARRIDRRARRAGRRRDACDAGHRAVGRGRAAEPAGRGAGRAARPRRAGASSGPTAPCPVIPSCSSSATWRRSRPTGATDAAARHQPGRDPGGRGRSRATSSTKSGRPAAPAVRLLRQGVHGDDRARPRRRAARAAAHVGASSPGWRGCSFTSGIWSASATAWPCSRTGSGPTSCSRHGARVITGRRASRRDTRYAVSAAQRRFSSIAMRSSGGPKLS